VLLFENINHNLDGKFYHIDHPIAIKTREILGELSEDEELKKGKDMSLKDWLIKRNIPEIYHTSIDSLLAQTNSSTLDTHSAKGAQDEDNFGEQTDIGNGNYHLEGKYTMENSLVPYLTKKLNMNKHVKLNYLVKSIDYRGDGVIINGGEVTCDKLILTVPISILRNQQIDFNPPLPPIKKHIIQNMMQMHGGMKVILRFKKPFWKTQTPNTGVVVMGSYDPVISQFWYSSTSKEQEEKYGHIVTGFSMSNKADNALIMEEEDIKQHFRRLLQNAYNVDSSNDGYLGGDVRNWQHIQHIAGAYSFASVSEASRVNYIENARVVLSEPLGNKVYFAGEVYCNHSPATIHGAMETGQKAALDVLQSPFKTSKL